MHAICCLLKVYRDLLWRWEDISLALSSLFHIPSHKKCARILDGTDSVKNLMEQSHIVVIRLDEGGRRWFAWLADVLRILRAAGIGSPPSAHLCRSLTVYCRTRHVYISNWSSQAQIALYDKKMQKSATRSCRHSCTPLSMRKWRLANKWSWRELNHMCH